MYKRILDEILKYSTIIIHRHSNPDGDAIGSQAGLGLWLKHHFPEKQVFLVGDGPGRYSFVPSSSIDQIGDEQYQGALAILLDTATPKLISDDRYRLAEKTIRFDHHLYVETFTDLECVDPSFESCCGLLADFMIGSGLPLTPAGAEALFIGLVTDSGRFRYDSISPRTFRIAAALMDQGLDVGRIYRSLYAESLDKQKLRAAFTGKIQTVPDNVAFITTTKEELAAYGIDAFTASRGMVGVMSDIKDIDIWVNFTEDDSGILCELRSSKYCIQPIAVKYGGGGHEKACGAVVPDFDTAMKMVADLQAVSRGESE